MNDEKITKTNEEWRTQLTSEQYYVCRQKGTERAFTGMYWDCREEGVYRCVCCNAELFPIRPEIRLALRMAQLF